LEIFGQVESKSLRQIDDVLALNGLVTSRNMVATIYMELLALA